MAGNMKGTTKLRACSPAPVFSNFLLKPINQRNEEFNIQSSQNSAFKPVLKKPKIKACKLAKVKKSNQADQSINKTIEQQILGASDDENKNQAVDNVHKNNDNRHIDDINDNYDQDIQPQEINEN